MRGSHQKATFAHLQMFITSNLLVCNEDLESPNHLSERDGLVCLPVVCSLNILNEDDEVLVLALVVNLGLLCWHICGWVERCLIFELDKGRSGC